MQAVLAAWMDRLPPEEKRLLQTAAVMGTKVPFTLLKAIAEMSEEELLRTLKNLQAKEFLYETHLFPAREYTFKHALTQQVAYESLLQERRRSLHVRIVEVIETRYAARLAEQVERLAYHTFRGEVWEKALTYCRQAGMKAMAGSANREATAYFEQALVALQHLPPSRDLLEQAIDLRCDLRNTLFPLGEHQEKILKHLRAAEILAETLADYQRLGRVSAYITGCFWIMGEMEQAMESGQRALTLAIALKDIDIQIMANYRLGQVYYHLGDYRQAIHYFKRNIASFEGELVYKHFGMAGLPSVFSRTILLYCLSECGEFAEGVACAEEAFQIAEAVNHPFSLAHASSGVGLLYLCKGELAKAISILTYGLELTQTWNLPVLFPTLAFPLGYVYALAEHIDKALPLLNQALEQATFMGRKGEFCPWMAYLGEAYLLAGRIDKAQEYALQALGLSRTHKERGHQAWALRLLGEIHAHHAPAEMEQAAEYYRQALTLAEELGMRPLQAHCRRGLGLLYGKAGRREHARTELATAIALYRSMEMTFWLTKAEARIKEAD
jgi:tetratricopeptide (TPR) repeat protein